GTRRTKSLDRTALDSAFKTLLKQFDWAHGGWGGAPKFPQPMALEFLLRYHLATSDESAWRAASTALEAMARGGIYDHLGGGFHRYSVDSEWKVPHFEKMLYDNAQLARVYLHAWQMKREPFHRAVCEEVLDYVLREMTSQRGGFFSAQDADSEGVEGKFYVWTAEEVRAALTAALTAAPSAEPGRSAPAVAPDARSDRDPTESATEHGPQREPAGSVSRFLSAYALTEEGNVPCEPGEPFEGKNILRFVTGLSERPSFAGARKALLSVRYRRVPPARDEKILTSWNGLMLAALAEAGVALGQPKYLAAARANADFLLTELRSPAGRLYHAWTESGARLNGYLEDYSYLMEGLLALYQATFEERWYQAAAELAGVMLEHFSAPGGLFDTSDDHEALILRTRETLDNAVPSGSAMAATALLKLAGLSADVRYSELARSMLESMQDNATAHPLAFGQWLVALDHAVSGLREVAIVGDVNAPDTAALVAVCRKGYRANQVVAAGGHGTQVPGRASTTPVPLLSGRSQVNGQATAYVCRDFTCLPPVTKPSELEALLG
ncbi:MAG: thioredoxin domain-containing protein, partial [Candidatus Eisenbacteria bacterium]|nr:thioredoxin domain-containing protein [Candidatus Eisenbacteria bacterium]